MPAPNAPSVDTVTIEDHEVVRLHEPASGSIAHVVPSRGSNVTRFATRPAGDPARDAVEVIAGPPTLETLSRLPTRWGAGMLFPYPGRVSGDAFEFRGRRIDLPADPQAGNAMHGAVRWRAWRVIDSGADHEQGAWVTTRLASREDDIPDTAWPWAFACTLRIVLRGGRLRIEVRIENESAEPMPFGLGFHPYLWTPLGPAGSAEDCEVALAATERWISTSTPPAEVSPVATDEWPRRALPLSALPPNANTAAGPARNHKFILRGQSGDEAGEEPGPLRGRLTDRANGLEATLDASEGMRTVVFYTPPDAPVVSFEPHTCMPNAFNLMTEGIPDPGLIVLEPGEAWDGWYQLRLEALP